MTQFDTWMRKSAEDEASAWRAAKYKAEIESYKASRDYMNNYKLSGTAHFPEIWKNSLAAFNAVSEYNGGRGPRSSAEAVEALKYGAAKLGMTSEEVGDLYHQHTNIEIALADRRYELDKQRDNQLPTVEGDNSFLENAGFTDDLVDEYDAASVNASKINDWPRRKHLTIIESGQPLREEDFAAPPDDIAQLYGMWKEAPQVPQSPRAPRGANSPTQGWKLSGHRGPAEMWSRPNADPSNTKGMLEAQRGALSEYLKQTKPGKGRGKAHTKAMGAWSAERAPAVRDMLNERRDARWDLAQSKNYDKVETPPANWQPPWLKPAQAPKPQVAGTSSTKREL